MTNYAEWLWDKYREWMSTKGRGKQKQVDFARYLGVSQASLSHWLNADNPPTGEHVQILADKLGYEIYDILGVTPPYPPFLHEAKAIYISLPPDEQKDFENKFIETMKEWLSIKE